MKSYLRHSKDPRCQGSGLAVPLQVCVLWPPGEKYLHTSRAVDGGRTRKKKKKGRIKKKRGKCVKNVFWEIFLGGEEEMEGGKFSVQCPGWS